ncbi:MAG: hypothetical protein AAB459_02320 [Patescibacteria group bacterium]
MKTNKSSTGVVPANKLAMELLILVGTILLLAAIWGWWHYIYSHPNRVFWGAVDNSMKTHSVLRSFSQSERNQSLDQTMQLQTAPNQLTLGNSVLKQGTGEDEITVRTDLIGNPFNDFIRYSAIETSQKGVNGNALDFSKAVGEWGKTESEDPKSTNGQLYNQATLAVIPFGAINAAQRAKLVSIMQSTKAYEFQISEVSRKLVNGRPNYTFKVVLKPEGYITLLKEYAGMVGLTQLANVDPNDYARRQSISFSVSVDVWSRQITEFAPADGGRVEKFTAYNALPLKTQIPDKTIPMSELQSRVQSVQ